MPTLFSMSFDERYYVVASVIDSYWIDTYTGMEMDLDDLFEVELIRFILYDDEHKKFYFLTNKYQGRIGFFLIEFDFDDPNKFSFMTMWKSKLELDDANIFILRGHDTIEKGQGRQNYKELIISFKTCYLNTFNVIVQDLADK
jgi:hypothetical protein